MNADPDEADPTKADPEELKERLAPTDVVFADDPEDLSNTFKLLHEGTNLWDYFLWAVLVVLVFETFVSNWLSPKPAEDELRRSRRECGAGPARNTRRKFSCSSSLS